MERPSVRDELLDVLDRMAEADQRRVLSFARALVGPIGGTPGRELLRFAGTTAPEEADRMSAAIEEGCGKADPEGW